MNDYNHYFIVFPFVESILEGIGMKNTKHETLPYPLDKLSLSRADNATPQQLSIPSNCRTTNVRDGTYFNDNNVRIKRTIPIRKQSWT